ncbi:MAG: radical SAM protein, partial [Candidatus Korarchaeota archaeon]|nr:radical SAM protein [Candidatus Korarchaeota archaeon]NIU82171.1 radical SAM protein [Candidatus Thorarchaeota archaeon]NIW14053.1 radical SAM protein [Candidatus Thorarchaeota archaeon]NIW52156.1 radical SAM protein [Candidatus Korarchaeota archaeon]
MQQTFPDFGNTMPITMAKRMLARNFSRIQFKFEEVTWNEPKSSRFGVYLHVPFCKKLCAFCPFYKVLYDEQLKDAYLNALTKEIKMRIPQGEIPWFYMGGGTPNLLDPPEIEEIISTVRDNRSIDNMGMEGTPRQFTRTYLRKIKAIGMDKISMGIESLNPEALHHVHRDVTNKKHITNLIEYAKDLGLSVNVDLMIGLPSQTNEDFLRDIKELAKIGPQQ